MGQGRQGTGWWWACLGMGVVSAAAVAAWMAWPATTRAGTHPDVTATATNTAIALSPTLQRIRTRGEVIIGVRTDFPPFGMLDARGRPRGLEVDLAQALADHLDVRLRLVPVTPDNRFARLHEGAVDLLIASAGGALARQQGVTAVEPHYYGSGVNVLLRPERTETAWHQLRGHTLCAVQDAPFNAWAVQRHHVSLHEEPSVAQALAVLSQGRCVGLLYSEAAVQHLRRQAPWRTYRVPLDSALVVPWAVSLARSEHGTALEREVGDALARWHREGTLIALEKKWGLRPSRFLQEARTRWGERRADGTRVCARDASGQWPTACRDAVSLSPQQAQGVLWLALGLRDRWGVRLAPVGETFDATRYLQSLAFTGVLAGAVLVGAWLLASRSVRGVASGGAWAAALAARIARGLRTGSGMAWARFRRPTPVVASPPMWALLAT